MMRTLLVMAILAAALAGCATFKGKTTFPTSALPTVVSVA